MPSLKSLRTRIGSVKNTKKITSTMKMVAAAKMRRATIACEQARPFADGIAETVSSLSQNINKAESSILLKGHTEIKTAKVLVFGSDKGLCGGFNAQLVKATENHIETLNQQGIKAEIITFGNKARDGLKEKFADQITKSYLDFSKKADFSICKEIADELVAEFEADNLQQIDVIYNKFINVLTQEATVKQLAPVVIEETETTMSADVILEPSANYVLNVLLPRFIASNLHQSYLESFASEQACRMTAMEGSTKNATDVINKLSLEYNRQRQANITSELVEIISGAQALND
jgi:F-type H+-transporting ATPase subunit gamma|tara:strand:- start:280 stop:1152 length:873 start_codon:yes stop_codon:yes gene_type:complete